MANQLTGKILYIYPSQQIASKDGSKTIVKRGIVIDCTRFDPYTGERGFENTPMLEFIGDRCAELDKYQAGQVVTISFDVQGTRYRNKDNVEQIFTRVQPYRIEPRQTGHSSAPVQQPTPQPTYQQQPQNFPPPVDANGNVKDDLPFQRMLFDLKNDMEEIWKTVKGYNGYYQVSNTGKVRNPNKVLTPNVGVKNGYVYVTLRKDKRLLHRIVAETFIPNPFNKPEVDHINGIRTDNNVCNLRWVTRTENNNNPITKSRFSKSAKGKVINAETKKRMSMSRKGEKHPMYNKKHSSFSKRKMSITHSIPVVQFGLQMNYIAEFESAKVASLETQVAASSINACTLGKRKTAGGYIWKKKNDI